MVNSNEAQTESSTQPVANPKQDSLRTKNTTTKLSLFCTPIFTLILAAIALFSAFYAIYSNVHSHQLSNQQTQTLNLMIDDLKQQQIANKESIHKLKETANQSEAILQSKVQELNKNLQAAIPQPLYQQQDWLLLKARYYLELAQINAHWSNDQPTTIALLKQADDLLATLTDQRLFTVRQAIAKEITEFKALPKIDIPGLLSQLDAAQNTLVNLPIKQPLNSNLNKTTETANTSPSPWRDNLKKSMTALEKLVVIRHNDEAIVPLLSPLNQTLLRDSIRFSLQEAQWAILQNSSEVYQLALNRALENIKSAFDENSGATKALIKELQNLQQEKLLSPKARLEESLPLLNQVIESKNSQAIEKSAALKEGKTP